jgi:hypothetical protein
MSKKFTIEEVKKIPPAQLMKLINIAKEELKQNSIMQEIFEEYDEDVSIIDFIPTMFADLDVSAKTDHGIIFLNYKLLTDGDFKKDYSYLIHEYTHWAQQCLGDKPTKSSDDGEYLNNPAEQEGFQNQIEYIADEHGEKEADKYLNHLLDHHDIKSKERTEKKEILKAKV